MADSLSTRPVSGHKPNLTPYRAILPEFTYFSVLPGSRRNSELAHRRIVRKRLPGCHRGKARLLFRIN
jgi:hypothetical protein